GALGAVTTVRWITSATSTRADAVSSTQSFACSALEAGCTRQGPSRCPARMHRTRTMARRSKASSAVTDDGRAAHLRNSFFISAPAPSPHVDVPTSPFSIAPPAASAPVAERPVLHWLRADDDVQVATLAGEFAGHVVSDLTTHSAYGPHAVRLGDYLSLIAAKSALKAALAPRIEGEDRLGRRLSWSATGPHWRRRNRAPRHTRSFRQRRTTAMAPGIVTWFNADRGHGFIAPEDGSADVFAHSRAIAGTGRRDLEENQRFEFDVEQGSKGLQ